MCMNGRKGDQTDKIEGQRQDIVRHRAKNFTLSGFGMKNLMFTDVLHPSRTRWERRKALESRNADRPECFTSDNETKKRSHQNERLGQILCFGHKQNFAVCFCFTTQLRLHALNTVIFFCPYCN